MIGYKKNLIIYLIVFYLIFSFIILPMLSPLRNLGIIEPGLIRNAILPPLLIAIIISLGINKILKPKIFIQLYLVLMFIIAAIVGINNLLDKYAYREYFSHLFQIVTAYTMCITGWVTYKSLGEKFWKIFITIALLSTSISSIYTISSLSNGDIGRYYTAAYGFILIASYSANRSFALSILSFLSVIISNKRSVVLSFLTLILFKNIFLNKGLKNISRTKILNKTLVLLSTAIVFVISISIFNSSIYTNSDSGISKAYNISINRLNDLVNAINSKSNLDEVSSGRIEEIDIALSSMSDLDYFIGNGAGWTITLDDGRQVQNIHFSPLSLASVYGVPLTIFFYFIICIMCIKFIVIRNSNFSITELMAPTYIIGALVHSFFAYSLFIDWMFFYFIGVLGRSLHQDFISKRCLNNV